MVLKGLSCFCLLPPSDLLHHLPSAVVLSLSRPNPTDPSGHRLKETSAAIEVPTFKISLSLVNSPWEELHKNTFGCV